MANCDLSMQWWALMGHANGLERADQMSEAKVILARADQLLEEHPSLKDDPLRKLTLLSSFARACVRVRDIVELKKSSLN